MGFNQESKIAKNNVPKEKTPGKISKILKNNLSFRFLKSDALPALR